MRANTLGAPRLPTGMLSHSACALTPSTRLCASRALRVSARNRFTQGLTQGRIGLPRPQTMDPAKWTPSLNQRDELDRAMKTAGVLREWAALKRQGIIDDAEFQAMKARLLGRPPRRRWSKSATTRRRSAGA